MRAAGARLVSNTVTAPVDDAEPRGRRWWRAVLPVAVLIVGVSLLVPALRHQWAVSVFRQPTRYTALWFSKAWALPTVVTPYTPQPVSFVISNQEGRAVHYRYLIRQSSAGLTTTLAESGRTIGAGRSSTITTTIRPTCLLSPCRIEISLPGHSESIDFNATVDAR